MGTQKHIAVIGSGPGGLAAAMILANRGYRVTVFERKSNIGGRNQIMKIGDYSFDIGPTFLMMDFVLRKIFNLAGRDIEDYLDLVKLEPMYKLNFIDRQINAFSNSDNMKDQLESVFTGESKGFDRFMKREKNRYDRLFPCLQIDYSYLKKMFTWRLISSIPYFALGKSLYDVLGTYFGSEECKLSFTFQAKYLGMSPWKCPGLFTIIPYIEHAFGVYHVAGGLGKISEAMGKIIKEHNGTIYTDTPVQRIITDNSRNAKGVLLQNGKTIDTDAVVINADFGYAMETLFEKGFLKHYSHKKLSRLKLSCSTFMIYLCLDTVYNEPHHQIIFAKDYYQNITDIVTGKPLSDDISIYVRNAGSVDKTLAPPNHSAVYVLVPVPNLRSQLKWDKASVQLFREKVIKILEQRTSMSDLHAHIVAQHIISPQSWKSDFNIFEGATFSLSHNLLQMLYFRPHNRFNECKNVYLAGGGTHPGSGLPTIYESASITANCISEDIW